MPRARERHATPPNLRRIAANAPRRIRESGGIGRRTSLRSWRGSPWGFESPLSHHLQRRDGTRGITWTSQGFRLACKPHSKRSAQLERRLNVAVPVAEIEGEVQKRLTRLAKTVKVAGFRPGKVPLRDARAAVRPAGALGRHHRARCSRPSTTRCARRTCASPARRASSRSGGEQPAADALEFSAVFEVYPDVQIGDVGEIAIERPHGRSDAAGRRPHARRAAPAAHDVSRRSIARRAGRRSRARRLHRHDRRRRVPGRAGAGFPDRARRRRGCCRSSRRRSPACRPARRSRSRSRSRPTTTARKSPARKRSSR